MTVWSELAKDLGGIALFLTWLVLPPIYVIALGRRYVRQAREAAQEAIGASEEVQEVLDDLDTSQTSQERTQPTVPAARMEEDTWRLPPVEQQDRAGKHRLDSSRLSQEASCPR